MRIVKDLVEIWPNEVYNNLISSRSLLEDLVKVFSEVILEERCQQDFE